MDDKVELQVLICTYGREGIERVAKANHPQVKGVRYLVSWQMPEGDIPVPDDLNREDFDIVKTTTRGLTRNRNIALREASAPLCLISDDDVSYSEFQLRDVIKSFSQYKNADVITFRFNTKEGPKNYPDTSFSLHHQPKGYFASSIEIAFRREKVMESKVLFNEHFGIGAEFIAHEEIVFIHDILKAGLTGIYLPITIAEHPSQSTRDISSDSPLFIRAKGAAFIYSHRFTWPIRMILHAMRHKPAEISGSSSSSLSRYKFLREWIKGALQAYKLK